MLDDDARETEMKAIEVCLPPGQGRVYDARNGENPPPVGPMGATKNRRRQTEIGPDGQTQVRDAPGNRQSPDGGGRTIRPPSAGTLDGLVFRDPIECHRNIKFVWVSSAKRPP